MTLQDKELSASERVRETQETRVSRHPRIVSRLREMTSRLPDNTVGALWILQAAFLFTVMAALIKLAGSGMSVFQILAVRQAIMVLIVAPRILAGLPGSLATKRPDLQAARVVLATTTMLSGFTAIIELPLADATTLSFSKTFFVTLFAIFLLGEQVGRHRWGATIAGFFGILIMLKPNAAGFVNPYALLALGSAITGSLVLITVKVLTRTDPPITILTYQAIFVGLIMAVPAYLTWTPPTLEQWGLLALIGAVSWAAQMSNIRAFRSGEASAIASLDYTRLLYATIFGIGLFGHWPSGVTLLGAGIIILAALYTVRREAIRGRELARNAEDNNQGV
ncbi:DMT family transporter [Roseibium sp. RKSG952]|uniref:DMT family transporter n=1 Tax=Roseibium sp. RKSG952 TaxID=2529384 RepID=UPI0012BB665D|nr:DMT family transporter [Roseibium sp. RKSG952]MTH97778.1 DMT family transporter [Roseibium sp. RKSG952]